MLVAACLCIKLMFWWLCSLFVCCFVLLFDNSVVIELALIYGWLYILYAFVVLLAFRLCCCGAGCLCVVAILFVLGGIAFGCVVYFGLDLNMLVGVVLIKSFCLFYCLFA